MSKFRKKPVVIEAFQMTKKSRWNNSDWPNWLHEAWNKEPGEGAVWIKTAEPVSDCMKTPSSDLVCGTLEGVHRIDWNDFIIQGIKKELYPCKPDIFEKTYELVE